MKMRILVLSTGRRVSLIRHLRRAAQNLDVSLFLVGTEIELDTPSLFFCDAFEIVPRTFSDEHHLAILSLIQKYEITHILPGNDLDLLYLSQRADEIPARLLCSHPSQYRPWLQKSLGSQAFEKLGLKVPKVFDDLKDVSDYPLILKEDFGFGSVNQYLLNSNQDLIANLPRMKHPFLQKFVSGPEYTVDVFCDDAKKPVALVSRLRKKVRSGVSDVGVVVQNSKLIELVKNVASSFNLAGPWNVQCIEFQNEFYFLEVNPRFSGGIPLTIASGADFATYLLQWALGLGMNYDPKIRDGLKMLKLDAEVFFLDDLEAGIGYSLV